MALIDYSGEAHERYQALFGSSYKEVAHSELQNVPEAELARLLLGDR